MQQAIHRRSVALAIVVATAFAAIPAGADEWWPVESDDALFPLHYVTDVHHAYSDEHGVEFRLFETAGGDPVINGNRLWLAIVPWDPSLQPRAFRTEIDVASVSDFRYDAESGELVVDAAEQFMTAGGEFSGGPVTYAISFESDWNEGVSPWIAVGRTPREME